MNHLVLRGLLWLVLSRPDYFPISAATAHTRPALSVAAQRSIDKKIREISTEQMVDAKKIGLETTLVPNRHFSVGGEPLELTLRITNSGKQTRAWGDPNGPPSSCNFQFAVFNERGEAVSLTAYGKAQQNCSVNMHSSLQQVGAGGNWEAPLVISRHFDLSLAGKYTVIAWRNVAPLAVSQEQEDEYQTKRYLIVSKPIVLEVYNGPSNRRYSRNLPGQGD